LASLVGRLGLEESVRFRGPLSVPECWQAMREADVYVAASAQESFGLATLEAASVGVPVVATDVGIASRAVGPVSGRLLPASVSVEALAMNILDLLSNHQEASAAASLLASRVLDEFSWERTVKRYAALFGIDKGDESGGPR
jgi:glycosyltransferase involved in cell wall biosynthesis